MALARFLFVLRIGVVIQNGFGNAQADRDLWSLQISVARQMYRFKASSVLKHFSTIPLALFLARKEEGDFSGDTPDPGRELRFPALFYDFNKPPNVLRGIAQKIS
ncbi:MAG: hypothetical protein HY672_00890 [Chloroflexi bacterium]|nr:hypothetical protein [Chloroflexota bacterium]